MLEDLSHVSALDTSIFSVLLDQLWDTMKLFIRWLFHFHEQHGASVINRVTKSQFFCLFQRFWNVDTMRDSQVNRSFYR